MTITTEGIILPAFRRELEDFAVTNIEAEVETADDGTLHIFEQAVGGRPFDLVGDARGAHIVRAVLLQLWALTTSLNSPYTLNLHAEIINYKWRHWDAPVIEATPYRLIEDPQDTEKYYSVRLKMVEV